MNKPLLEGDLVTLRPVDPELDFENLNTWSKDSLYARLLDADPVIPWPKKMTKEWMEKHLDEFLEFVFYRKGEPDKPIGFVGLSEINWVSRDAWVGIGIGDRGNWGKGYGTDAMRIMLRYAFCQLNLHRISLSVFDYNPRGVRSYEKAGFVREGVLPEFLARDGKRFDIILMGILRSDWKEACPED
jgi:RimJ/RimL family protein N-acetyltransferase